MRSHFERIREVIGSDDVLIGTVVARLDVAAQNHAVAEGYADPYPSPFRGDASRAHTPAHERASDNPHGGCPTPTASMEKFDDGSRFDLVIRTSRASYETEGFDG